MSDETRAVETTVISISEVANSIATLGASGDAKKTKAGGTSTKSKSAATPKVNDASIQRIPLDGDLKQFSKHYFKDKSEDEIGRLSDSIKENGLIQPVIVRPSKSTGSKFEIICGHSRVKAAKKAGFTEIDAIVRDMTDDEAIILAIETNIAQRSFKNWLPSEKAKNVFQYHEVIKKPGRRSDLERNTTPGQNHQGFDDNHSRRKTAIAYGVSESTIKLYLSLDKLDKSLMERLDNNEFKANAAYEFSQVPKTRQQLLDEVLTESKPDVRNPITGNLAKELRLTLSEYPDKDLNDTDKEAVKVKIRTLLTTVKDADPEEPKAEITHLDILTDQYDGFFHGKSKEEAVMITIKALDSYFNSLSEQESSEKPA